jgi:hypothetical protein
MSVTVAWKQKRVEDEDRNGSRITCHLSIFLEVDMRDLPGGVFTMGSDHFCSQERPRRKVRIDPFWIDKKSVTNRLFDRHRLCQVARLVDLCPAGQRDAISQQLQRDREQNGIQLRFGARDFQNTIDRER